MKGTRDEKGRSQANEGLERRLLPRFLLMGLLWGQTLAGFNDGLFGVIGNNMGCRCGLWRKQEIKGGKKTGGLVQFDSVRFC